jgi:hypothetical protein
MRAIISLTVLWFTGGATLTWSLGFPLIQAFQIGFVGVIAALVYVVVVILPVERNRRLFFEGAGPDDEHYLHIGCLWIIPLAVILWALIILLVKLLF